MNYLCGTKTIKHLSFSEPKCFSGDLTPNLSMFNFFYNLKLTTWEIELVWDFDAEKKTRED